MIDESIPMKRVVEKTPARNVKNRCVCVCVWFEGKRVAHPLSICIHKFWLRRAKNANRKFANRHTQKPQSEQTCNFLTVWTFTIMKPRYAHTFTYCIIIIMISNDKKTLGITFKHSDRERNWCVKFCGKSEKMEQRLRETQNRKSMCFYLIDCDQSNDSFHLIG